MRRACYNRLPFPFSNNSLKILQNLVSLVFRILLSSIIISSIIITGILSAQKPLLAHSHESKRGGEINQLREVNVAVLYQSIGDNEPRDTSESIQVLKTLNPDFIWYGFGIAAKPLFYSEEQAREKLKLVGVPESRLETVLSIIHKKNYTVEGLRDVIRQTKLEIPYLIFTVGFHLQFLAENALDPETLDPIPKQVLRKMALNLKKWKIINPKTGNSYSLEETQELFRRLAGYSYIYPDITSPEYREYVKKRLEKLIDAGVDGIWFDFLFTQATSMCVILGGKLNRDKWDLSCNFYHPAVRQSFRSACEIARYVHDYARERYNKYVYVGTWSGFLLFPYTCNEIDFITENPDPYEILSMQFDDRKWEKISTLNREKYGNRIVIFLSPDWGPWDNTMMAVFSQQLTPEQQRKFLEIWDRYARSHKMIPVYPVHGGDVGPHAKKLSYGRYRKYDALAPEFQTYKTIRELALKVSEKR